MIYICDASHHLMRVSKPVEDPSALNLGTTIAYVKYACDGIPCAGVVVMADGQSTAGHEKWRIHERKIHEFGKHGIIAYAGSAYVARLAINASRASHALAFYNDFKHSRDAIQGKMAVKMAEKMQSAIVAAISKPHHLISSIAASNSKGEPKPYVSTWYGLGYWESNKLADAIGSGSTFVKQYLETRDLTKLTAVQAEAILLAAIRRAKAKDLYTGGQIMAYHISPLGRSLVKYFDPIDSSLINQSATGNV